MHRFYCPPANIFGDRVELGEEETRHLRDVLRTRIGDRIAVFDGDGREFECVTTAIGKRSATAEIAAEIAPSSPESPLALTIAVGLLKGEKYDFAVQKAVELGVRRFIPMATHRSEIRADDAAKRLVRWQKIALEASKQCGRAVLMTVDRPKDFEQVIEDEAEQPHKVLFSEEGTGSFSAIQSVASMLVMIGPKGGWEAGERQKAAESGYMLVTLGGRIMRVETAVIAISAILQHRFGDMN